MLAGLALLGLAAPALGQSWLDRDAALDLRADREQSSRPSSDISSKPDQTSKSKEVQDFEASITIPVTWVSAVTAADRDTALANKPDFHSVVDVGLRWSHQYAWFKASASFGAIVDRYLTIPDGNIDSLHGTMKVAFTDGKSDQFIPYLSYAQTMFFDPTFRKFAIAYYDTSIGFSSGLGLRGGRLIDFRDATKADDMSVNFDLRLTRRLSDQIDYQSTLITARADFDYTVSKELTLEASPKFRARWYDNYFGDRRIDYRPSLALRVIWKPEWLKALVKRSEINFGIEYFRNYSNLPDKNYDLWEIGPSVELRAKF